MSKLLTVTGEGNTHVRSILQEKIYSELLHRCHPGRPHSLRSHEHMGLRACQRVVDKLSVNCFTL